MAKLRKAIKSDFGSTYPLLKAMNPKISKDTWSNIFDPGWHREEDYVGYLLEDEGRVVGFLGYIFSTRMINGKTEKFCNMTTWNVDEKYRKESLSLLYPIFSLKDYSITNFTASKRVNEILNKFEFKVLDKKAVVIWPNPMENVFRSKKCWIEFGGKKLEQCLNKEEQKIYEDHLPYKCFHFLIKSEKGNCYCVMTVAKRKRIPYGVIQFISNSEVFSDYISNVILKILLYCNVFYLQVDERLLKCQKLKNSFKIDLYCQKLYKSQSLKNENVDNVYSELFLLNI